MKEKKPDVQVKAYTAVEIDFFCRLTKQPAEWVLERLREAGNSAYTTALYAQSEAIKRNGVVSLCPSRDGTTCTPSGEWSAGWLIFVNLDRDSPAARDAGEERRNHEGPNLEPRRVDARAGAGHGSAGDIEVAIGVDLNLGLTGPDLEADLARRSRECSISDEDQAID